MTLTIELHPEQEARLRERAARSGLAPADYARGVIERDLERPPAIAEVMAPVREDFSQSGMTEAELDALIDEARDDVFRDKQARQPR
jgi:hypothetical protein